MMICWLTPFVHTLHCQMEARKPLKKPFPPPLLIGGGALLALSLSLLLVTSSLAQSPQPAPTNDHISGVISVVWADPAPGDPTPPFWLIYLTTSSGKQYRLDLDPALIEQQGGAHALEGQTVTVSGQPVVALPAAATRATDGDEPVQLLKVQTLAVDTAIPRAAAGIYGKQPTVSILCKFADVDSEPRPRSHYQTQLANTYPGLDHYWRQVSYNHINLEGSNAFGWYQLPRPKSYYVYPQASASPELDTNRVTIDCLAAADADVFFPDYAGINLMLNDDGGCCSYGGRQPLQLDGQERMYGISWFPKWGHSSLGVVAHEMGHTFGMPHSSGMYGAVYDNFWDVMSNSQIAPVDATWGSIPEHPIAHQKYIVGWLPTERVLDANALQQTFTLTQLAQPGTAGYLMARVPFPGSTSDYYTVEARRKVGYDQSLVGNAVIIHRKTGNTLNPLVLDIDGNGYTGDAGAMWTVGETFVDSARGISIKVNSVASDSFSVTITTKNPPRILNPSGDVALPPGTVHFEWQPQAGATGYQFQIDTSPSLSSPSKLDLTLTENSHAVTLSTLGRRYWRVRGLPNGSFSKVYAVAVADPVLRLTNGQDDREPHLVSGSGGEVYQYYYSSRSSGSGVYRQRSNDDGLNWSAPALVGTWGSSSFTVTAGPNGRTWLVWSSNGTLWQTDSRDDGLTWSESRQIADAGGSTSQPELIRAQDGRLWLVAARGEGSGSHIYLWRSSDEGQTWSTPVKLSDGDPSHSGPALVQTSNRTLLAVWSRDNRLVKRTSADGSTWGETTSLTADCCWSHPSLARQPDGAIWLLAEKASTWYPNSAWWSRRLTVASSYLASSMDGSNWTDFFQFFHYAGQDSDAHLGSLAHGTGVVWSSKRGEFPVQSVWFSKLGEREDTNAPPAFASGGPDHLWAKPDDEITFSVEAADESPGLKVHLVWSLDGVEQTPVPFSDGGEYGIAEEGDRQWSTKVRPQATGPFRFRFRAEDTQGNVVYSSQWDQVIIVSPPFVKQNSVLLVVDFWLDVRDWAYRDYGALLTELDYAFDQWDTAIRGPVPEQVLMQYRDGAVVWVGYDSLHTLNAYGDTRPARAYLEGGGRLLLTGCTVGEQLASTPLLRDYLYTSFLADGNATEVIGAPGDAIGDQISAPLYGGSPSARRPDILAPVAPAVVSFLYAGSNSQAAAIRVDTGTYRSVIFGFGLEGITDLVLRKTVLLRSLTWLGYPPPARARLSSPADGALLPPGVATFAWNDVPGATGYRLQLATSPQFTAPLLLDVATQSTSFTNQMDAAGVYYWRVVTLPDGAASNIRKLTLRNPAKPVAVGKQQHNGALVQTAEGRTVAIYEEAGGLLRRSSSDGGVSWDQPVVILPELTSQHTDLQPAISQGVGGRLWLVAELDGRLLIADSLDDGLTWGNLLPGPWGAESVERPAITQTAAGQLVLAWTGSTNGERFLHIARSTNEARSWSSSQQWLVKSSLPGTGPTLLVMADGTLLLAWDTGSNVQLLRSSDGVVWYSMATPFEGCCARDLSLAQGSDDRLWLAYVSQDDVLLRSSRNGGTTWGAAEQLTTFVGADLSPSIAVMTDSEPAMLWTSNRGGPVQEGIWFLRLGYWEDTDPPPAISQLIITPEFPLAGESITLTTRAADESAGVRMEALLSINGAAADVLPMYDDGAHGDGTAGDGTWGRLLGAFAAQSMLSYQVRARDARDNVVIAPLLPAIVRVLPPFENHHALLLVQDAGSEDSFPNPDRYRTALDDLGYGYDVWSTAERGSVREDILRRYLDGCVIWSAPNSDTLVGPSQQDAVIGFLNARGRLFISGPLVARRLAGSPLLTTYLYAGYPGDAAQPFSYGIEADPIGDRLTLALSGGDSISNVAQLSTLSFRSPATPVLRYGSDAAPGPVAGLKIDTGTYRAVLLGFGLASVSGATDRARLLDRTLGWLGVAPNPRVRAYISPPIATATSTEPLQLDIMLDAGVQRVDRVVLELRFDPSLIAVVTAAGNEATTISGNASAFISIITNEVDNTRGTITYVASSPSRSPEGLIHVARLWVKSRGVGETALEYASSTQVSFLTNSVLEQTQSAQIMVEHHVPDHYVLNLPIIIQ